MAKKKPSTIPLLYRAPSWAGLSQNAKLFHGCVDTDRQSIEQGIDPLRGKARSDFGRGFYTTSIRRQAEHWAWKRHFDVGLKSAAVVLEFNVARHALAALASLSFVVGDFDAEPYWSLVQHCRQLAAATPQYGPHQGWYDVVAGPVAAMWRQRVAMLGADQISFHTTDGTNLLNDCIKSGDSNRYRYHAVP